MEEELLVVVRCTIYLMRCQDDDGKLSNVVFNEKIVVK